MHAPFFEDDDEDDIEAIPTGSDFPVHDTGIDPAEAECVAQNVRQRLIARFIRNDIQVACRIGRHVIEGRWDYSISKSKRTDDAFDCRTGPERMAIVRFRAADRYVFRAFTENLADTECFI